MLNLIKTFLIISVVILPDYYILESPFRLRIVAMVFLLFVYLIDSLIMLKKPIQISKQTQDVLLAAFAVLLYVYVSDVIKNDAIDAARSFYPNLLILTVLPIFEYKNKSMDLHKVFYFVFGFAVLFAMIQIFGLRHNLSTLFSEFIFLKSDQIINPDTEQHLRVSGPGFSTITFALYLGYFIIITYYLLIRRKNIFLLGALGLMICTLFFTQTRSAIYGLLPSILVVQLFYGEKDVKQVIKILFILCGISISIIYLSDTIERFFPRLYKPFDASVIERFQTNYYATIAVLRESPVFGIPKEEAPGLISGTVDNIGLVFGDTLRVTTTHHNQILYYFRYYGLVGVGLLLILYILVFKKIIHAPSGTTKMMLLSIIIFDLQYSMGHNNKLINNILLWILLSMSSRINISSREEKYRTIPRGDFNKIKGADGFKERKTKRR